MDKYDEVCSFQYLLQLIFHYQSSPTFLSSPIPKAIDTILQKRGVAFIISTELSRAHRILRIPPTSTFKKNRMRMFPTSHIYRAKQGYGERK